MPKRLPSPVSPSESRHAGALFNIPAQRLRSDTDSAALPARARSAVPLAPTDYDRRTIWIDLENTPHVPFFRPIIREFEERRYKVVLTARRAFQTCEMANRYGLIFRIVGRHYGARRLLKAWGLMVRSLQLVPFILQERPILALNHGSRSQNLIGNLLRIPTVMIMDYEHCTFPPLVRPRWEIVPDAFTKGEAHCATKARVRTFSGIKEDVYVPDFSPDPSIVQELGLDQDIIATVRPPATEALYHSAESEALFVRFMDRACHTKGVKVVLLPRNDAQKRKMFSEHSHWFDESQAIVPTKVVDGLNLLWHSDLAVSGGGTMNREAAALGIPVYSIFRGKTGAVDFKLEREKRLTMIRSLEETDTKILLRRRTRTSVPRGRSHAVLQEIVSHVEQMIIAEHSTPSTRYGPRRRFALKLSNPRIRSKTI